MNSVNKVILIGNVGKAPEIRSTQSGSKVANLTIATSESWTSKHTGQREEKTEWHRLVVWGKLAEIVEKYIQKGSKIYIEGKLETRKWADKDGKDQYTTEINVDNLTMLDSKRDEPTSKVSVSAQGVTHSQSFQQDEEIPF